MIIPSRRHAFLAALGVVALVGGTLVALYYHHAGLTLSHYDARGHLVVARRIFDNLTPGWRQIGAVWLPLPHLLNAIPVQLDVFYRSGASAVAMSVVSFAVAVAAIAWIVMAVTGSRGAAVVGAAVFALNPNALYLQAAPMTEPLLLGLLLPAIAMLMAWCRGAGPGPMAIGSVFALACLTRYEAWPVTLSALIVASWARWRSGARWIDASLDVARIGALPALAIVGFMAFSKVVVGEWFVASGFFVPDNPTRGRPVAVAGSILWGLDRLSGHALVAVAVAGLAALLVRAVTDRARAAAAIPLTLLAGAALPFGAFVSGHPFRIRYMVPLLAAQAVGAGAAAGLWTRGRVVTMGAVVLAAALELRPLSPTAPMVVEAQWDRPNALARQRVTACLRDAYDGTPILASMNSLGHYMQELSTINLDIHDFIFEGNYDAWRRALDAPRQMAGWILISEGTDGRDALFGPARENPAFLHGFSRVCEGGNVALYRRVG